MNEKKSIAVDETPEILGEKNEKSVLIALKDFKDCKDFAEKAAFNNRKVFATCDFLEDENLQKSSENQIFSVQWNKTSAISARSLLLACENYAKKVDEAILYFDEPLFAANFEKETIENYARTIDSLIHSVQYLTFELLSHSVKKIVFLHKTNRSLLDSVLSTSDKAQNIVSNPTVSSCAAAFDSFAENTAANLSLSSQVLPILVRADVSNDVMKRDGDLAKWLFSYIDAFDALKNPPAPHRMLSWIKPGAKTPNLLPFFR